MAYFGFGGLRRPRAQGKAASGSKRAEARVGGASYGSGQAKTGSKAPYIAPGSDLLTLARAGDGQRFPFTSRVVPVPVPVLIVDEDGSLIV